MRRGRLLLSAIAAYKFSEIDYTNIIMYMSTDSVTALLYLCIPYKHIKAVLLISFDTFAKMEGINITPLGTKVLIHSLKLMTTKLMFVHRHNYRSYEKDE